jgi:hypothetical protein
MRPSQQTATTWTKRRIFIVTPPLERRGYITMTGGILPLDKEPDNVYRTTDTPA